MPATPDIDFRPWTTYQSQAFEIELHGNPPNALAQKWADWISCPEQYLLQEHPWAPQGRGKITTTWKKCKPAFWEQLQVRFRQLDPSEASRMPCRTHQSTGSAHQRGDNSLIRVITGTNTGILMQLTVHHTIAHQLKEAQQAANDENRLQYKEWLKQGQTKGLRGLFRSLRSSEMRG